MKEHAKLSGAAGANALGAALGSLGLLAFALVGWQLSTLVSSWLMLLVAFSVWSAVALAAWIVFQCWHLWRRRATRHPGVMMSRGRHEPHYWHPR